MRDDTNITDDAPMLSKKIARSVGRAVADFGMIARGSRIAVGLSGGKDSMMTALALERLRRRSPVEFSLVAITVDPTGGSADLSGLASFAACLGVEHEIIAHPIFDIIDMSGTRSPCSLCANIRRGILANAARAHGCDTLALGHHADDAIETALMDLMHAGRWGCFMPKMTMDRTGITVIRPLIYVQEASIVCEVRRLGLVPVDIECRHGETSRRADVKRVVASLAELAPNVRESALNALRTSVWTYADSTEV